MASNSALRKGLADTAAVARVSASSVRSRRTLYRRFAELLGPKNGTKKERVVILGSGWAGYAFARTLDPAKYERVVISPRSYFVFTPLLASTAVGTLEFRTILEPIRRLTGIRYHQGWADDVDFTRKVVRVEENRIPDELASRTIVPPPPSQQSPGQQEHPREVLVPDPRAKGPMLDVPYDKLVVAVGAYSQTFGISGVREHAHFLRDIGDARRIRLRVLALFEQCASPSISEADRRRLLHFAVVGGGPTGIEFAAELHDLVHEDLARIYPPEVVSCVRITVYDIAPKVLPMFDRELAEYATRTFARQGIDVRTEHHLLGIRRDEGEGSLGGLMLKIKEYGDEEVPAGMVVWSTGLMQNPLVEKLGRKAMALPGREAEGEAFRLEKHPRTGSIMTDSHLRAQVVTEAGSTTSASPSEPPAAGKEERKSETLPDVFVIGDCSVIIDQPTLPKTAQVASQQAVYLAKMLNKTAGASLDDARPFRFRNLGTMAYLGSWKAIHQKSSTDGLKGWAAWVLWRTAYLTKSMSIRNKILVPVYWFCSWAFGRGISRF